MKGQEINVCSVPSHLPFLERSWEERRAKRSFNLEFQLEFFFLIGEIVEDVWGDSNHGDPSTEQDDVGLQLLQSSCLVRFTHEHSWKHFCFFAKSKLLRFEIEQSKTLASSLVLFFLKSAVNLSKTKNLE